MRHVRPIVSGSLCGICAALIVWFLTDRSPSWIATGLIVASLGSASGMRNGACAAYAFLLGVIGLAITLVAGGLVFSDALISFAVVALLFGAGWMFGYAWFMARIEESLEKRVQAREEVDE